MHSETSVARGAAALYAANIITLFLNALYLVLLTNYVSLAEVGLVSLLNVILVGIATLAVLALPLTGTGVSATPPAVTRFISQYMGGQGSARRVYLVSVGLCGAISLMIAGVLSFRPVATLVAGRSRQGQSSTQPSTQSSTPSPRWAATPSSGQGRRRPLAN
jgi:O-antigen/teichoic acid export membrane protein